MQFVKVENGLPLVPSMAPGTPQPTLQPHLAPRRADLEQVFAGANFNTEKVSGAHVEVSGAHFKVLSIIKSLRSTVESLLKVSGAQFNEIMSRIEALFLANTCNNCPD